MANKRISGITIEIGGDTSKLGKALDKSEKESRSLQVELRQIEKLLKFDPTNTELLTQKQKALAEMVDATSDKLKTLKEAEAQVVEQFERGEIGEDTLRAFQREIIKTENELENMSAELKVATRNLEEFGDNNGVRNELEGLGEEAENAGDSAVQGSEGFTVMKGALAGLVAEGIALAIEGFKNLAVLANDFDKASNTLQAQTGATAEEMAELESIMEDIYANNLGESIDDVAQSMGLVKQQTGLAGEELQKATENALVMRDTFDMDVNESIRAVNSLMNQFGIDADTAYNLVAQGAQKGLNQNGDLLDTINEYSVQFASAGYSAEDMFNMLANGASEGTWSIDKLGDAVKEYNIRWHDQTANEALSALGFNAEEMANKMNEGGATSAQAMQEVIMALSGVEDEQERYLLGQQLMGTMWEDLGEDAVLALMNTQGEIKATADTLETINEVKYDDIDSAMQGLGRTLQMDVVKPIGDELTPAIGEVIDALGDMANGTEGASEALGDSISNLLLDIVDTLLEYLPKLLEVGTTLIISLTEGIISALPTVISTLLTLVSTLLNTLTEQLPGLTDTIVTFITESIPQIVTAITSNLPVIIESAVNLLMGILDALPVIIDALITTLPTVITAIIDGLLTGTDALTEGAITLFNAILEAFPHVVTAIMGELPTIITTLVNGLLKAIPQLLQAGIDLLMAIVDAIPIIIDELSFIMPQLLWAILQAVVMMIPQLLKTALQLFGTLLTALLEITVKLTLLVPKLIYQVMQRLGGFIPQLKTFGSKLWSNISKWCSKVWSGIKNTFANVGSWFRDIFSKAWSNVKAVFSSWGSFFGGLWTTIKNKFSSIGTSIAGAISGAVRSGINGVISSIESTINRAIRLINGAIRIINKAPGVNISTIGELSFPRLARGGIVDDPTIAEIGEDGKETILPLENNTQWLDDIARRITDYQVDHIGVNDSAVVSKLDDIYNRLDKLNQSIVLDTGVLVGQTIDKIDQKLANNYALRARRI